jgi:hypothetical protein
MEPATIFHLKVNSLNIKELVLDAPSLQSIAWQGDELVDWAGGGTRISLSGKVVDSFCRFSEIFNASLISPSGRYAVIYTRFGTKGVVLHNGKMLREINRSYYCAEAYEYPVCLFQLRSGQEVIAHCPDEYNRIEIDDLKTGTRLTATALSRSPADFFHSRLSATTDGRYLLSAGWIWHPVDAVRAFNIEDALRDSTALDGKGVGIDVWSDEGASATFLTGQTLATYVPRVEDGDVTSNVIRDKPELAIHDLATGQCLSTAHPVVPLGTMFAMDASHVLDINAHPKLVSTTDAKVAQEWKHISSGSQVSSILVNSSTPPLSAFDPIHKRCAIVVGAKIHILVPQQPERWFGV